MNLSSSHHSLLSSALRAVIFFTLIFFSLTFFSLTLSSLT
jgi:hypothetical protein